MTEKQQKALMVVAERAAILFRPPYRRLAKIPITDAQCQERCDFELLYEAITDPDCPVEIGEELT